MVNETRTVLLNIRKELVLFRKLANQAQVRFNHQAPSAHQGQGGHRPYKSRGNSDTPTS